MEEEGRVDLASTPRLAAGWTAMRRPTWPPSGIPEALAQADSLIRLQPRKLSGFYVRGLDLRLSGDYAVPWKPTTPSSRWIGEVGSPCTDEGQLSAAIPSWQVEQLS